MSSWKTPDEIIRLQRLKQRTKALQARIDSRTSTRSKKTLTPTKSSTDPQKRKNPFADKQSTPKRLKAITTTRSEPLHSDLTSNDDSIFTILSTAQTTETSASDQQYASEPCPATAPSVRQLPKQFPASSSDPNPTSTDTSSTTAAAVASAPPQTFMQFIVPDAHDDEDSGDAQQTPTAHVPIDWGLKTKLRLLTLSRLTGNGLKTCQEASGITSFVRCLNPHTASDGLDISLGARFHQATMYWQHPHVPWLTLFPRNGRSNGDFQFGEPEREALAKDWTESFRALFQLLRARQCPYFYVCANSYNVLFCAAGIGGRDEQHAYLTPTSRGMRAALKQEEIEFVLPLKAMPTTGTAANRSLDSGVESTSFSNGSDEGIGATQTTTLTADDEAEADSDDEDQDEWLASLGVEASEIRKIGSVNARVQRNIECAEDFSDHSIALIEGVECQAFFNFLLNSKSTITKTGRLAGVPPTLLAPVAFPGASLRSVQTRASQIRMDGVEYHSLELRGVILPHVLPYLCGLMRESKDTFSASLTGNAGTNAFSRAAQRLMEDQSKENAVAAPVDQVFGRENLSDCGLPTAVLQAMCHNAPDAVRCLERMCFNKEIGGYTWN